MIHAVRKTRTMEQSHYVIALEWEDPAEVSEVSELFLSVICYRKKTVQGAEPPISLMSSTSFYGVILCAYNRIIKYLPWLLA